MLNLMSICVHFLTFMLGISWYRWI